MGEKLSEGPSSQENQPIWHSLNLNVDLNI